MISQIRSLGENSENVSSNCNVAKSLARPSPLGLLMGAPEITRLSDTSGDTGRSDNGDHSRCRRIPGNTGIFECVPPLQSFLRYLLCSTQ
ncbi:hypothetical protein AVEN_24832-1 [Araneus ventricosus]|uniref:Uncharacterized protein n=1 Tax=Araneus ventricosus TaxID=182803 RepID=A0A4Y2BTR9_ARAVE|nr:hypothetical protein AVEN_24832-1 [Araneus ventricosus]